MAIFDRKVNEISSAWFNLSIGRRNIQEQPKDNVICLPSQTRYWVVHRPSSYEFTNRLRTKNNILIVLQNILYIYI